MPFNQKKAMKVTGLGQNCLLNCLVPTIFQELSSAALALKVSDRYSLLPGIVDIRDAFREFYGIAETITNEQLLEEINQLLKGSAPQDRELILGPVLRVCLGHIMTEGADHWTGQYFAVQRDTVISETQFSSYKFMAAVSVYLRYGDARQYTEQYFNLIESNKGFLDQLHGAYTSFCNEHKPTLKVEEDFSVTAFLENYKLNGQSAGVVCRQYWEQTGYTAYAAHIAKPGSQGVALNAFDIVPLLARFGMSVNVYGSAFSNPSQVLRGGDDYQPVINVHRIDPGHFEREEASAGVSEADVQGYNAKFGTQTPLMDVCSQQQVVYETALKDQVRSMLLREWLVSTAVSSSTLAAPPAGLPPPRGMEVEEDEVRSSPVQGQVSGVAAVASSSTASPSGQRLDLEREKSKVLELDLKNLPEAARAEKLSALNQRYQELHSQTQKAFGDVSSTRLFQDSPDAKTNEKGFSVKKYLDEYYAKGNEPLSYPAGASEAVKQQIDEDRAKAKVLQELEIASKFKP